MGRDICACTGAEILPALGKLSIDYCEKLRLLQLELLNTSLNLIKDSFSNFPVKALLLESTLFITQDP